MCRSPGPRPTPRKMQTTPLLKATWFAEGNVVTSDRLVVRGFCAFGVHRRRAPLRVVFSRASRPPHPPPSWRQATSRERSPIQVFYPSGFAPSSLILVPAGDFPSTSASSPHAFCLSIRLCLLSTFFLRGRWGSCS